MLLVAGLQHSFAADVENSCHFTDTNHIVKVSRPALDGELRLTSYIRERR